MLPRFIRHLCLIFILSNVSLYGNGIAVTNLQYVSDDASGAEISFTVSWENSWRLAAGPSNYDAAYIFGKFRENNGPWRTMQFASTTNPGGAATLANAPDPSPGFFAYRSTPGAGNVSYDLTVNWDYQAAGVDGASDIEVKIFALEMVYVPEGEFLLGDGTIDNGTFYDSEQTNPEPPYSPYRVFSESQIRINTFNLYYADDANAGDQTGILAQSYPKGFRAFYCMKYETSQQQWVDFFNTLTAEQQLNLDVTGLSGKNSDEETDRNGISWDENSPASTTLPDVALNYAPNDFYLAYLDWAGLRPMTELEFEKACRGKLPPQPGQFAWGTDNVSTTPYTLVNTGTPSEQISNAEVNTGNAAYGDVTPDSSPLRVGIFAASAVNKDRQETGGSYYGIMEMSGNLLERCISVGSPSNRDFTGMLGDGELTTAGRATAETWPNDNLSFRGGSVVLPATNMQISDRSLGSSGGSFSLEIVGIRGVIQAE